MPRKTSAQTNILTIATLLIAAIPALAGLAAQAQRTTAVAKATRSAATAQDVPLFQPPVTYPSSAYWSQSVAIADLRGNGNLDLVVANAALCNGCGDGVVSVLLGNGDGTFQSAVNYDTGGGFAISVAVADLNGDGKPDLAVANQAGTVAVLLGNGDGTFQPAVVYNLVEGYSEANAVAVADVNGDGRPDLLVSVYGADVNVLLGNGDGTFQPAVLYGPGCCGQSSIAVADVNGDGKPDLLVTSGNAGCVLVMLGNGDGTFQPAVPYSTGGTTPASVAVADVNGDGKLDLLIANEASGSNSLGFSTGAGSASVLLGNGDGTFQPPVVYLSNGVNYHSIAVADVNGDGKLDLVLSGCTSVDPWYCWWPPDSSLAVLLGNGDGTFQPALYFDAGAPGGVSVAVGDLNHGGRPDAAVITSVPQQLGGAVAVLLNSTGTTTNLASTPNPSLYGQPVTLTATVTSPGGTPPNGETVTFYNGSAILGSGALSGGVASFATSSLPIGINTITATYAGDSTFAASTSIRLIQTVNVATTSTTLTSSPNPSTYGQTITFTATVASNSGAPPNGETVTFYSGSAILGAGALSRGVASYSTSSLPAGVYNITASYAGDSNFAASTSPVLKQTVNSTTKSPTSTTLTSTLNPSIYGQSVALTATVITTGSIPPTGTVAFTWSDFGIEYTLGTATLNSAGVATLTKSNFNADTYPIVAVYSGDANNLGSSSAVLNQVVNQATSAATLTSSPNPSSVGEAVTFKAEITSPTAVARGPVTFTAGNTVLGTVELDAHKAKLTTTSLPAGANVVTVTYQGDSNIKGSSASVTQVVQ